MKCSLCGSTKRNKSTLKCVCGANVPVDGEQSLFDEVPVQDPPKPPTEEPYLLF